MFTTLIIFIFILIIAMLYFKLNRSQTGAGSPLEEFKKKSAEEIIAYTDPTLNDIEHVYIYVCIYLSYVNGADRRVATKNEEFNKLINNIIDKQLNDSKSTYYHLQKIFTTKGDVFRVLDFSIMDVKLSGFECKKQIETALEELFLKKLEALVNEFNSDALKYVYALYMLHRTVLLDELLVKYRSKLITILNNLTYVKCRNTIPINYIYNTCNIVDDEVPRAIKNVNSDYVALKSKGYKQFKPISLTDYNTIDLKLLTMMFNIDLIRIYLKNNVSFTGLMSTCTLNNYYLRKICNNINQVQELINLDDDLKAREMYEYNINPDILNNEFINTSYDSIIYSTNSTVSIFQFLLYVQCYEYINYLYSHLYQVNYDNFIISLISDIYTVVNMNKNVKFLIDQKYRIGDWKMFNSRFYTYFNFIDDQIEANNPTVILSDTFMPMCNEEFTYEFILDINANDAVEVYKNICKIL